MPNHPPRVKRKLSDEVTTSYDRKKGGNSSLLPDKEVKLTGSQRFIIQRAIERVPHQDRTRSEQDLLELVR